MHLIVWLSIAPWVIVLGYKFITELIRYCNSNRLPNPVDITKAMMDWEMKSDMYCTRRYSREGRGER
jgi:hypothetical protein